MSISSKAFLAKKIVSIDGPKSEEIQHEALLLQWCAMRIEPEEESNRRRSVLERIHNIVRVWIRHTMITEFRMPESAAAQVEGRIFATGSYRYNVHTSGSDIDMVLIAPSRITREHFFNTLAPRLNSEPWVTDLHCITESRVPIIAMVCDGIDIDLSFGSIRQDRVPEVITDDLLQGLDEQSVLSCNAVRVAHNIMDLVPDKATFRQTLRLVKAWGKARAVYSNTFGFPSGIGWAILVAFVCQCYPKQNSAGVVTRFFRTYHAWFKPNPHESGNENRAIYLTESMRAKTHLGRCWDPRESKSDAMALFPVLTPALPYGNACYNVTLTNLRQLCEEFKRGHDLLSANLHITPTEAKERFGQYGIWSKLLEPVSFFGAYKHYLHIQVACVDPDLYQAYVDAVESKIRILWAGNAQSRGNTLEDYKSLRLHLNPVRYEDSDEVKQRSKQTQKPNTSYIAHPRTSSRLETAGDVGEAPRGRSSLQTEDTHGTVNTYYTAHYFIGITVDTSAASTRFDFTPSIRTFQGVVRQLKQYKDGVTKLPEISVEDMSKVPQFVKDAAGYKETTPADIAVIDAAGRGGSSEVSGVKVVKEVGIPSVDDWSIVEDPPAKRTRHDEATGADSSTGGSGVVSRPSPAQGPDAGEDDLEQALGLDF